MRATKECKVCGVSRPLERYGVNRAFEDNIDIYCKECLSKKQRLWRLNNPEKAVEKDRKFNRKFAEKRREWERLQYEKTPQKKLARTNIYHAVRRGDIVRPSVCEKCGKECKPVAHHEDYFKRFDVQWLCVRCHAAHHYNLEIL